ncbi:hypothetical protein [Streptosporangium sp. NPDC049644]|uniref:hypothetical protein n=1 Tax=Streptosporangium sp. NPDC049644 TaxID=3155507 RepID=UPI00341C5222
MPAARCALPKARPVRRGGAVGAVVRPALGVLCKEPGRHGEAETHCRGAPARLERHEVERLSALLRARSGR